MPAPLAISCVALGKLLSLCKLILPSPNWEDGLCPAGTHHRDLAGSRSSAECLVGDKGSVPDGCLHFVGLVF